MLVLALGYSGDVNTRGDGLKHVLTLSKMDLVRKLFSPSRFSGETFFAQRHFKRVPSKAGGKTGSVYDGRSAIVVIEKTPFCINYAIHSTCNSDILHSTIYSLTLCNGFKPSSINEWLNCKLHV